MAFRTQVVIDQPPFDLSYQDKVLLLGSCFAENMGNKLESNKFDVDVNPFGTLYNPLSIERSLQLLIKSVTFSSSDLFKQDGAFHSFTHHSRFSAVSAARTLQTINNRMQRSSEQLTQATRLIITFGTAYVYCLKTNGEVVANCHKLPERCFNRKRLSVEEIVASWRSLLSALWRQNPTLNVVFTVSPIRHWKDGAQANQISKAILLLAVETLAKAYPHQVSYFPAYEIMMDELRDYRFYADDMLHPSSLAIEYIWERFLDLYLSKQTRSTLKEWEEINKAIRHQPFQSDSEKYRLFILQTLLKAEQIREKFPSFDLSEEIAFLKSKLA